MENLVYVYMYIYKASLCPAYTRDELENYIMNELPHFGRNRKNKKNSNGEHNIMMMHWKDVVIVFKNMRATLILASRTLMVI